MQVAQPGRVGRRHVHRHIVDQRIEAAQARHVIRDRIGAVPVGAEVGAEHARPAALRREPPPDRREPGVVEAHAVDQRLMLGQAEQPRPWIAGLRPGRHRADLEPAEALREQARDRFGILVEAGGEAERVG